MKENRQKIPKLCEEESKSENAPMDVDSQNQLDGTNWELKRKNILNEVKIEVRNQLKNTTKFEESFLKTINFTHINAKDEVKLKLKYSIFVESLVERCIPELRKVFVEEEYQYNAYYPVAYKKASNQMLESVKEHYLAADTISRVDEKARKERTIEEFKPWWLNYLNTNEDGFMNFALNNALNWFNEWFSNCNESYIRTHLQNKDLANKLLDHMDDKSYISDELFEDMQQLIVDCIAKIVLSVEVDKHVIQYAFDEVPFVDDNKSIEQLSTYVDACMLHYEKFAPTVIAPYFVVCQSSGYGKSRVIAELGKQRPLLYVSLQKIGSSGYPRRTTQLADQCFGKNDSINDSALRRALQKCMEHYETHGKSPTHLESKVVYGDLSKIKEFKNEIKITAGFNRNEYVVLVVDEARELLEPLKTRKNKFRQIRDLLASMWNTCHVFAILVDTQSHIANFSPSLEKDPAGRKLFDEKKFLYHSYILNWTFDSMKGVTLAQQMVNDVETGALRDQVQNKINSAFDADNAMASWKKIVDLEKKEDDWKNVASLRRMGRPLWKWSTPEFGRLKLYGTSSTPPKPSFEACLAIVFCRIGCMMSSVSDMTSDLVANHMATLLETTVAHRSQLVGYISDPYLVYCATTIWDKPDYLKKFLLPAVRTAFVRGALETGYLGELVARIIILCILDKKRNVNDQCWASVRKFIKVFDKAKDVSYIAENAKMGVFHFVQYTENIAEPDLPWLVKRRAGAMLKRNHPGADILLPYWYKDEQGQIQYRFILVKVNNTENSCDLAQVFSKLRLSCVFEKDHPFQVEKYQTKTPRIVLNLKNNIKENSRDAANHLVPPIEIKYFIDSFKLYRYKEYLHGCEDQLIELMQDSYGVKKWQKTEHVFSETFEKLLQGQGLPKVEKNDEPTSYFNTIPERMVYEQLPYNRRI